MKTRKLICAFLCFISKISKCKITTKKQNYQIFYRFSIYKVNKQVQNYQKSKKNSTLRQEKFNFSLGLLSNLLCK